MINSTLGGLLKDYRLQKGMSQFDIAFSLGWKETSRLSRIEQGKTERPPRELLDKILTVMGLEDEEKNSLLLIGGYLPTDEEILRIKEETSKTIKEWPYPAVLIDFSWRVINQNALFSQLYKLPPDFGDDVYKSNFRVLDALFSKHLQEFLFKGKDGKDLHIFLKKVIAEYKYEQRHRTKEKWFIDHIKQLMNDDLFRTLWTETNAKDRLHDVMGKYVFKKVVHPEDKNKVLSFYLFVVPAIKDPRFDVELLLPADADTFAFYNKVV